MWINLYFLALVPVISMADWPYDLHYRVHTNVVDEPRSRCIDPTALSGRGQRKYRPVGHFYNGYVSISGFIQLSMEVAPLFKG